METLEREAVDNLLLQLNKDGFLFPQFEFRMDSDRPLLLGHGGFSSVYGMQCRNDGNACYALKVGGFEKHIQSSEEFWNTVRIQEILCNDSANIVRVLNAAELIVEIDDNYRITNVAANDNASEESWEEEGNKLHLQFVLMEELQKVISKDRFGKTTLTEAGPTDEESVVNFAMQMGSALMCAHDQYVMHRDIKLENIFFDTENKSYKLGDFGIAKCIENDNAETIVYTDGYGAPEIERHLNDTYSFTADIYSFGITLYLLLNDLKFPGSDGYYSRSELQYNPEFIFPAPCNASEEMARIIRKMCSYKPEDRYQYIGEVLFDLANVGVNKGIDGAEDILAIADVATETYREENVTATDSDISAEDGENLNLRANRIKGQIELDKEFKSLNRKYIFGLTILFTILLKSTTPNSENLLTWMFLMLPAGLLIEALFQKLGDFHIIWGIGLLALTGFSVYSMGFSVPAVLVALCVLPGISGLSFAGSAAIGLWLWLDTQGGLDFLDFLVKHNLWWVVLIIVICVLISYIYTNRNKRIIQRYLKNNEYLD